MTHKPALSLVASPGRRAAVLEAAAEAERRGFAGIACPSLAGGAMALATSLAHVTCEIPFWTSVQPIYVSVANELAMTAGHVAEVSGGRFRLGLGVSHQAVLRRMGLDAGRPLADMEAFVTSVRAVAGEGCPPVYVAAMRDRMLDLAARLADGAIWANACRSDVPDQLRRVPEAGRAGFFRANMVPTVIADDRSAAAATNRRTMGTYVRLPNYRNYWREVGYAEEMDAIEAALAARERDRIPELMSERWLSDCTLYGSAADVRDGFEAWADAGVVPIAVMSSTWGGQLEAVQQLFAAYE